MISHRVQKYIDDHSFCSEYLFRNWEAFLDFLYEEGGRVSSILWWDHCRKNLQHASIGSGGYIDPDDREWMYAETWLHEDGFEERSLADIKANIQEMRQHGLVLGDKYNSSITAISTHRAADSRMTRACSMSCGRSARTRIG